MLKFDSMNKFGVFYLNDLIIKYHRKIMNSMSPTTNFSPDHYALNVLWVWLFRKDVHTYTFTAEHLRNTCPHRISYFLFVSYMMAKL